MTRLLLFRWELPVCLNCLSVLKLAFLLPWSEWPVNSQGVPARVGGGDKAMDVGKEIWRR